MRIGFLVLLKTFQRLGHFIPVHKVPRPIAEHISLIYGVHYEAMEWEAYDASGARHRHIARIREHLGDRKFDETTQAILSAAVRQAALLREDLVDIINIVIEELVRRRYELPSFPFLREEAKKARAAVSREFFAQVSRALGKERCRTIDRLLEADGINKRSLWQSLKADAGTPTLKQIRLWTQRLSWLKSLDLHAARFFAGVPAVRIRSFALEARSLDAARMIEMEPHKRHTLAAALVSRQIARCLDDLGEMLIKKVRKMHRQAHEEFQQALLQRQLQTDHLIGAFSQVLSVWVEMASVAQKHAALGAILDHQAESLIELCRLHETLTRHNYLGFLWKHYRVHRTALFSLIDELRFITPGSDKSLEEAIAFIRHHRQNKSDRLKLEFGGRQLSLDWVPDRWWKQVASGEKRAAKIEQVDRHYFEMCVFTLLAEGLQSGDLVIEASDKFSDYRDQFVSEEEFHQAAAEYCRQAGLPAQGKDLVDNLRGRLSETANKVDAGFPDNEYLRIENGEPILRRIEGRPTPDKLSLIEQMIREQITPVSLLDAMIDTEKWLNWTRHFGPLSGHEAKLDDPLVRYLTAVFTYGCNLGPSQSAQAMRGTDRRQIAWINQRHISEEAIDKAIIEVINGYNRFLLPSLWGSGERASADGTKWDLYEQNLLSEYHIRYGGYGGIAYYLISDKYIALFSHFIPCGVREAIYILDGLMKNTSEIQPEIVHSDSHGQSEAVFGLAYLLGIKLMPRIKNWKHLTFYRPDKKRRYEHIDALFSDHINWRLISDNFEEMLKTAVSIKVGKLMPSTVLRRLGSYNRQNRLHRAFQELGRIVRTEFLLNWISDLELRRMTIGSLNKSEDFNRFSQWVAFGGRLLAENDRDEQRKLIKYNHLVANCLIFYNVGAMTKALHQMRKEGMRMGTDTLARLSPYLTGHVNRFGEYRLDLNRQPPPIDYQLPILGF
ncbi:MAG: Tn3 family transposase [Acidobacteria bacterium]|nr:Tn3 family transposase [Acidobacteriota bacterium]